MIEMPNGIAPDQCLIGGQWRPPAGEEYLDLLNPSDGSTLCAIARGTSADVDAAVDSAKAALNGDWGRPRRWSVDASLLKSASMS